MVDLVTLVAVLACTLFAGAAAYINLVEHPARLSCGTEAAARQWAPSYRRATFMQASLAVAAGIAGLTRWLQNGRWSWVAGSLAILAVVPVTLLVILPTNKKLLEPGRNLGSNETRELLLAWGRLHAIRTVLGLIGSILFIWASTHG
jgi:anthrone oxygenase-like protein